MDPYSSGEETVIKTRKPYTITKQRERWTEEEHNRFLEALKLHGRAWQRIEEHIGTKTAVQIRSHAQKFFTKLEKEALVKGVPVRQALDIEIPPPRPKRKPSNPYPRKTSAGSSSLQLAATDGKPVASLSSLNCVKDVLDLEKEPIPEKPSGDGKVGNVNRDQDEEKCTEPFSFLQDASSAPLSLTNKISTSKSAAAINLCTFREFAPVLVEVNNQDHTNESYIPIEPRKNQKLDEHDKEQADNAASNTLKFGKNHPLHGHLVQNQNSDELTQPGNFGVFSIKDTQAAQNYPRHVPVHIVDGSLGSSQNFPSEISYQEQEHQQMEKGLRQTDLVGNQPAFTTTEHHSNASRLSANQIFPTFHPLLTPIRGNQDNYASLFNNSTFSSFIVSALLQNPTAHATARFAATYWPCANMEASSADSVTDGIPLGQLDSSAPSIAAIAAATVAAATAWWAAHGLLPSCPFPQGFTCPPSALTTSVDNSHPRAANTGGENNVTPEGVLQETKIEANNKVSLQQQSASKSLALASLKDSKGSRDMKLHTGSGAADTEQAAEPALLDSSKANNRKQVDRSSCGSNTGSSSDTDALKKNEKAKEELKEADASPSSDSSSCGSRSYISLNDSWKEVSEEGRLAFKALFSREVLPQSFSPPQDPTNEVQQKSNMEYEQQNLIQKNASASHLDLNRQLLTSQQPLESSGITYLRGDQNGEEGMLSVGLGQVKLKVHRTGFKPYKRCTVEAKESRMACTRGQNDEKGPKRMRLGGEAST